MNRNAWDKPAIDLRGAQTARYPIKKATIEETTMTNTIDTITASVKDETIASAQLHVGRILYTQVVRLAAPVLPKFSLVERLFTSAEQRETVTMVAVYVLLHVLRAHWDHYSIAALTAFLNYELQHRVFNGIAGADWQKLLQLPSKVSK